MSEVQRPKVGLGVYIVKDGKVLFCQRHDQNKHAAGSWAPPGGHLEMNESWEECAAREALEETGVEIQNIRFMTATNDIYPEEHTHYVTLHMRADWKSGEGENREPDKAQKVEWRDWDNLPEPLMVACSNFKKNGYNPLNF
ncbi:MAG: 7,8-dihydro-8-oxoguanine triphosphatase [Parcubacteria group bacterium Athens0416_74]|nr:MAG: 7,8-dihydro-8-oxoguanine triphosphatase [Parcubacteria group bacterium Athens0416_74]